MNFVRGSVAAEQIRLLQRARAFLDERESLGWDVALDPECYLTAWARTPGNGRLRRLAFGLRAEPTRLMARALDAAALLRSSGYTTESLRSLPGDFEQLIVSWALSSDFDGYGAYTDRYLNLAASDTPRSLWLLILLNGCTLSQLPVNVRVLRRALLSHWRRWRNSYRKTPYLSSIVARARSIAAATVEQLASGSIRQVIMPYEAQPFQHAINLAVKQANPNLLTVGYVHSVLPALPTDYLFRPGAPDRLLVSGVGQREILYKHLGWPSDRVQVRPSLRYLRDRAPPLAGRIVLPYSLTHATSIARALEAFMRTSPKSSMPRWEVRIHPVMINVPRHLAFAQHLRRITQGYADRMSQSEDVSRQTLIIGATSAVIEALERGIDVVHICPNPLFEMHNAAIWTHIEVEQLQQTAFRYKLRNRGSYIWLGDSRESSQTTLALGA